MIKTEFLDMIRKERELEARNKRAREYISRKKRKKLHKVVISLLCLLAFIKIFNTETQPEIPSQYEGKVIDTTTVLCDGNYYTFHDLCFKPGTNVIVSFDTKGTVDSSDDEIVRMREVR